LKALFTKGLLGYLLERLIVILGFSIHKTCG
ncbi:MAG: hypothetical protein ACI9HU_001311, partial [Colwellia sp.]